MAKGKIAVKQGTETAKFGVSWYRGPHTNFIASKKNLTEPDAIDDYILKGWLPERPFITQKSPITAFGSCFAHEVTKYLGARGYTMQGAELGRSSHIISFREGIVNTFSTLQQFQWALEHKQFAEALWFTPDRQLAEVSEDIRATTERIIRTTDVFIVTLGVSEIWYNKKTGEVFWRAIPVDLFDEDVHGFRVSTVEENYRNIEAIRDLVRRHVPNAALIFTLSPVPLMATFRPVSCITASTVSKAVLRIAIDELMRNYQDDKKLFYFPAYEIVKEYFRDPYEDDNRHPTPDVIATVMRSFEKHYCTQ